MNKLKMILFFLLKLRFIKFGSTLPNTIRIGRYQVDFYIINRNEMIEHENFIKCNIPSFYPLSSIMV